MFIGWEVIIWDRRGTLNTIIDRGSQRGTSHRGTWTGSPNSVLNCEKLRGIKRITNCVLTQVICVNANSNKVFRYIKFDLQLWFWCLITLSWHTILSLMKNIDCRLLDLTETVLKKKLLFEKFSVDAPTDTQIRKWNH